MNTQTEGIIRNVFTVLGAWLLGRNLFGATLEPALWQEITGTVIMIAAFVSALKSKELTIEKSQTVILKVIMVAGTICVSSGLITGEYLDKVIMSVTVLFPIIYSILSKKKSADIASGEISVKKLSK